MQAAFRSGSNIVCTYPKSRTKSPDTRFGGVRSSITYIYVYCAWSSSTVNYVRTDGLLQLHRVERIFWCRTEITHTSSKKNIDKYTHKASSTRFTRLFCDIFLYIYIYRSSPVISDSQRSETAAAEARKSVSRKTTHSIYVVSITFINQTD